MQNAKYLSLLNNLFRERKAKLTKEEATIIAEVQPNANQNKVIRFDSGVWHLKIAAPSIKGKANQELLKFLSDILGVSKGDLTIKKGLTSKHKVIVISGLTQNQATEHLQKLSM